MVSSDGTPIAVWRTGSGRPLVLVHGTTADHKRWAPVLPAFEEHFSVLAIDRRGRGGSGDSDAYGLEQEYEDVAAVVEWAGSDVFLVGHSYGGLCSLEAARLTQNVERLVLYEPPLGFGRSRPDVVARLAALSAAGEHDELVAYFMTEVAGQPPDQVEVLRTLPAWQARVAAAATIAREERASREYVFAPHRFRELRVPTLFLLGSESPKAFHDAADAVLDALQDCRLVVMPGQRHAAMDTATDVFTSEVLRFLTDG